MATQKEFRHTMFATQALGLAAMFKVLVSKHKLGTSPAYVPELASPDGESTQGGKQALQHVSLMPEGGGPTIVIGSANTVDKRVELRTFRYLTQQYRQRFKGAALPFDKKAYGELVDKMQEFFRSQTFEVTLVDAAADVEVASAQGAGVATSRFRWCRRSLRRCCWLGWRRLLC